MTNGGEMNRFRAFEDGPLRARLERLRHSESDLLERVQASIDAAERAGRWAPSDPLYQRLSSVLQKVRRDLRETGEEQQRRLISSRRTAPVRRRAV
jgi:uncharacterized membrane protein YccC